MRDPVQASVVVLACQTVGCGEYTGYTLVRGDLSEGGADLTAAFWQRAICPRCHNAAREWSGVFARSVPERRLYRNARRGSAARSRHGALGPGL